MSLTQTSGDPAGHAADYAIDLSRNGISLYERVDATGWKLVETVPLQVGTLARNLERLKLLAGGRDGIAPLVDVWMPQDELKVCCIDFSAASSMENAVFEAFKAVGSADPLAMSYDFQPKLDDGTTPVAGIPADVLREARDFLHQHGFEPGQYTTAELPRLFNRPPEFPLLDPVPVEPEAPAPVASAPVSPPLAKPAISKPAAPKPAVRTEARVKRQTAKPRTAPASKPEPAFASPTKIAPQTTIPIYAKLLAGGAVAAMIGLAAVGLPMLMGPADTRYLPNERAQTAAALETPAADTSATADLAQIAALSPIKPTVSLREFYQSGSVAETAPLTPEIDRFDALIRPDLPNAPQTEEIAAVLPQPDATRQIPLLPRFGLGDELAAIDRFKGQVMTSAVSPAVPEQDAIAENWPGPLALPLRTLPPMPVDRSDPTLRFGRFDGDVQTAAAVLDGGKFALPASDPVQISLHQGEDIRLGAPIGASRYDLAMTMDAFKSGIQTDTAAPRRIVRTDEGVTTYVAELDLNGGRRAVQPLPMLRDDPALSLSRFEGTVQSAAGNIAGLDLANARDRTLPQIGKGHDTSVIAKQPTFIVQADPTHQLQRFEGDIVLAVGSLSPDNALTIDDRPQLAARQPSAADPVRTAVAVQTYDPARHLESFANPVQSDIGALGTLRSAILAKDSAEAPLSQRQPVLTASLMPLDLVDSAGTDEVLANARIIGPYVGVAPGHEVLSDANLALPMQISTKSPGAQLAALQVTDIAPSPASTLDLPDQITLAAPGQSILDGGLITPDNAPTSDVVSGLLGLPSRPAAKPMTQLAALTTGLDNPLATQNLPPPLPDPTRTVTPNHVLVITSRPDVVPQLRPRPVEPAEADVTVAAIASDPADALVAVTAARPDVVPPARADQLPEVAEGQQDAAPVEDEGFFQLASAPTDQGLVAVIADRPEIVPPARDGEALVETDQAVAQQIDRVSEKGVLVLASLPPVVPPNRFGAENADDSTVMILEPTQDQLEIAALLIKAQREGDLEPTNFALAKASAPKHRPQAMVEAYRQREVRLASLVPSDIALSTSDAPRSRPDNLKVVTARTGITPNVDIKASTFSPGPQLPTIANVAKAATISNALPMRKMSLIGVYGSSKNRHALVRLPSGKMVKVSPGDTVRGFQVTAISADAVRLNRRGRDTLLVIPH